MQADPEFQVILDYYFSENSLYQVGGQENPHILFCLPRDLIFNFEQEIMENLRERPLGKLREFRLGLASKELILKFLDLAYEIKRRDDSLRNSQLERED